MSYTNLTSKFVNTLKDKRDTLRHIIFTVLFLLIVLLGISFGYMFSKYRVLNSNYQHLNIKCFEDSKKLSKAQDELSGVPKCKEISDNFIEIKTSSEPGFCTGTIRCGPDDPIYSVLYSERLEFRGVGAMPCSNSSIGTNSYDIDSSLVFIGLFNLDWPENSNLTISDYDKLVFYSHLNISAPAINTDETIVSKELVSFEGRKFLKVNTSKESKNFVYYFTSEGNRAYEIKFFMSDTIDEHFINGVLSSFVIHK